MNKVMLMGRLTKDPEVRYSQAAEPMAIARYTLAVNRAFKKDEADFINVVAFGKRGEFAEKYLSKGQQICVVGRLQVSSYDDKDGNKRWSTDVVVEEHYFAESKKSFEERVGNYGDEISSPKQKAEPADGFMPIDEDFDDDLPF